MSRLSRRPRVDHQEAVRLLRQQPWTWLVVGDYRSAIGADSLARTIRGGLTRYGRGPCPYSPAGAFEARTEPVDDGDVRVWARYVGSAS